MSTDMFSRTGTLDTSTRARQSVRRFRDMIPQLSAYARALTGDDSVQVVLSASNNGATDGRKIYFRPPIELGDDIPHDRRLCDRRNERMQHLCDACRIREDILSVIYHEIAHIAYGTFKQPSEDSIIREVDRTLKRLQGRWVQGAQERLNVAPYYKKRDWLNISSIVSPYLPTLVNALEDARVNNLMFKARPGVRVMFEVQVASIFENGFEAVDENGEARIIRWNEQPLNAQICVGIFAKVSGYDYEAHFDPMVVEALADEELTRILRDMAGVRSAKGVYTISIPTLVRLNELGFLRLPEDEEQPEPEDNDETGDDEQSEPQPEEEGSSDDGDSGESDDEASDDEAPSQGTDEGSDDSDSSSDSSGEGSEPDTSDDSSDAPESDEDSDDAGSDSSDGGDPSADDTPGESDSDGDAGADDEASESGDDGEDEGEGSGGEPSSDPTAGTAGGSFDYTPEASEEDGEDDSSEQSPSGSASGGESSGAGEVGLPEDADDTPSEPTPGAGDAGVPQEWDHVSGDDLDSDDRAGDSGEAQDAADFDDYEEDAPQGVKVHDHASNDDKPLTFGTPDEALDALEQFGGHAEAPTHVNEQAWEEELDSAMRMAVQSLYFETESRNINGIRFYEYGVPVVVGGGKDVHDMNEGWDEADHYSRIHDLDVPESIIGPALTKLRVVFDNNARGHNQRNLKSGKVNARVLGRRAFHDDERLFKKKTLPGKRDYFVILSADISGSTTGPNIALMKRAIMAQAELLSRLGVDFAIYAHSAQVSNPYLGRKGGLDMDIYPVKERHEPWDKQTKKRLAGLGPASYNLDGHALEFLRKKMDESKATDKVIMYYSDGKMPAENHDEELTILQREIRNCAQKGYALMGVGIRTDSPREHGLDTVEVNRDEDLIRVITHLEKKLK